MNKDKKEAMETQINSDISRLLESTREAVPVLKERFRWRINLNEESLNATAVMTITLKEAMSDLVTVIGQEETFKLVLDILNICVGGKMTMMEMPDAPNCDNPECKDCAPMQKGSATLQ